MKRSFDVIIVGNGILGLSTAYHLAKLDARLNIAVVGPVNPQGSATRAAGAMLGHFGELTRSTLSSKPGVAKFEISHQASKTWPQWLDLVNQDLQPDQRKLSIRQGTFIIHNAASGNLDTLNYLALKEALTKYREPFEDVDPSTIPGLEPVQDKRPLSALYLPNERFLNPLEVLGALESILSNNKQVSLISDNVKAIITKEVKTISLADAGTTIQAPIVLIAAGAFSQTLIDQIPEIKNKIPRLIYGVGCSVALEYPKTQSAEMLTSVIRTINRAGACGLHVVPRADGLHYIGATNNVAFLPETDLIVSHITFLLECAVEQINQHYHSSRITERFVGNRPVSLDTFPLIGETSIKGLWLLSGTYRDGFHCSPILSQSVANQIVGKPALFNNIFQPERQLLTTMTKQQAIEEAAMQYVGSCYEHAMKLPNSGWHETFINMNRKRAAEFYERLECDHALSPDVFFAYDRDMDKHLRTLKHHLKELESCPSGIQQSIVQASTCS